MSTTRMSFSYPQEMKKKLQSLAKDDCRTLSSYIQRVLADHLEKSPNKKSNKRPVKGKVARKGRRA